LELVVSTQPDQRSRILDEIIQKSLNALDIRCSFRVAKWPDQLKATRAGNYMIWMIGELGGSPDPSASMLFGYGPSAGAENLSRFNLPAYNDLYRRQSELPDGPERLATLRQMMALLTAYAPIKFISHRYVIDMAYPWVRYYRHWAFSNADFWRYVDIDQSLKTATLHH
jgi:ABC-type transport system substrate-binding protein